MSSASALSPHFLSQCCVHALLAQAAGAALVGWPSRDHGLADVLCGGVSGVVPASAAPRTLAAAAALALASPSLGRTARALAAQRFGPAASVTAHAATFAGAYRSAASLVGLHAAALFQEEAGASAGNESSQGGPLPPGLTGGLASLGRRRPRPCGELCLHLPPPPAPRDAAAGDGGWRGAVRVAVLHLRVKAETPLETFEVGFRKALDVLRSTGRVDATLVRHTLPGTVVVVSCARIHRSLLGFVRVISKCLRLTWMT